MSHLSLSSFLVSLESDDFRLTVRDYERVALVLSTGGDWNLTRLRFVLTSLLARDMDQRETLLNRFDEFFAHGLAAPSSGLNIDIPRLRQEIDSLTNQNKVRFRREARRAPAPSEGRKPGIGPVAKKHRRWYAVLLLVPFLAYLLFVPSPPAVEPEHQPDSQPAEEAGSLVPDPDLPREEALPPVPDFESEPASRALRRRYPKVPLTEIVFQPDPFVRSLQTGVLSAGLLILVLAGYAYWLWHSRKPPDDKAPEWRMDKDRHFQSEQIGGEPARRFDDGTLSRLADSMGYFQSSEVGRNLDVPATVEATGRNGGIPSLVYKKPKHLRNLIILVDRFADTLASNPIPGELAAGLRRLGVPLIYGGFYGSPELFTTDTGTSIYLEDLESDRNRYLLLIFSDGKRLFNHRFALESLARWPMVAWMELRTRAHWDKGTALPVNYGIAVYPATTAGVIKAIARYTTERGSSHKQRLNADNWHGIPARGDRDLGEYLEALLGHALPWAQACAMLQPIGPGLADALRLRFHPSIPADHLELLYALPGTTRNVVGLRFSFPVLVALRSGFMIRRSEREQVEVLEYLLGKIDAAEPEDPDSPAHLSWEWVRERLNLELEPDQALKRLAELAKTPLKGLIKAEFSIVAGGSSKEDRGKIPLRIPPKRNHGKQRLGQLTGKPMAVMPLSGLQRLALAALSLGLLASLSFSAYFYHLSSNQPGLIQFYYPGMGETFVRVERLEDDLWTTEASGVLSSLPRLNLAPDSTWRLSLFGAGHSRIGLPQRLTDPATVRVLAESVTDPCREDFPEIGLTLLRCPDLTNVGEEVLAENWREALGQEKGGRLVSVGLSLSQDPEHSHGANFQLLWDGNAIDVLFLISQGDDGVFHLAKALAQMEEELSPWLGQTQVVTLLDSAGEAWVSGETLLDYFDKKPDSVIVIEPGPNFEWTNFLADHAVVDSNQILHLSPVVRNEVVAAVGEGELLLPARTYERVRSKLLGEFELALALNEESSAQEILNQLEKMGAPVDSEKQRLIALLASKPVPKAEPPAFQAPEQATAFSKAPIQPRVEGTGTTALNSAKTAEKQYQAQKLAVNQRLQRRIQDLRDQFQKALSESDVDAAGGQLIQLKKLTGKTSNEDQALKNLLVSRLENLFDQASAAGNVEAMTKAINQYRDRWPGEPLPEKWTKWIEEERIQTQNKMSVLRGQLRFAHLAVDPEWARTSIEALEALGSNTGKDRKTLADLEVHLGPLLNRIGDWTPARIRELGMHYYFGTGGYAKDPKKGVFLLRKAAESGDPKACFRYYMWSLEIGAQRNRGQAIAWFQAKAREGDPPAQSALGLIYANGMGIKIDPAKAAHWYRKAAEQGNPFGQVQLGIMYAKGQGVEKSTNDAVKWLRSAADQGYASGLLQLGKMYYEGEGIGRDLPEAFKLFRRAAKSGDRLAQYRLGQMYAAGEGTPQNEKKAVEWLRKAAQRGHKQAREALRKRNLKWTGLRGSSRSTKPLVYVFLPYHEYSIDVLRKRLQKRIPGLQFAIFASHRNLTRAVRTNPPDAILARPVSLVGQDLAIFKIRLIGQRNGLSSERLHMVRLASRQDSKSSSDLALLDLGGRLEMQKMLKQENLTLVTEMSTLVSLFASREVDKVLIPDRSLLPFGKLLKTRGTDLESAEFKVSLNLPVLAVHAESATGEAVTETMSGIRSATLTLIHISGWQKVPQ